MDRRNIENENVVYEKIFRPPEGGNLAPPPPDRCAYPISGTRSPRVSLYYKVMAFFGMGWALVTQTNSKNEFRTPGGVGGGSGGSEGGRTSEFLALFSKYGLRLSY